MFNSPKMDCQKKTCLRIRCLKRHTLPASDFDPQYIQTIEVRSSWPNVTYIEGAPDIDEVNFEELNKKIDLFYSYKQVEEILNQKSDDEDEGHTSNKQLKSIKSRNHSN